jgi:hypothetical protein
MSRLHFSDYSRQPRQSPARGRFLAILMFAFVGAVCAMIVVWPRG